MAKKTLWLFLWLCICLSGILFSSWVFAQLPVWNNNKYDIDTPYAWMEPWDDESDPWKETSKYVQEESSIINRLFEALWLDVTNTYPGAPKFLLYVKRIINLALGLLSFICLIMTIYTFYMMFFTDNDAWIKKAKWNLIGIFIALAIIGISRLIVSFVFRRFKDNWQNALSYNPTNIATSTNNNFYPIV